MPTLTKSRLYQQTHPWLTFELNLQELDHKAWLLLGEVESKCMHIAGAPLSPEVARRFHEVYLTKGIHGTTSIEGNTLSEDDVRRRITGDLELPPSREYQGREIDNVLEISNSLVDEIRLGYAPGLSVERILDFNRRLLEELPVRDDVTPGRTRTGSVVVGLSGYRGAPAEDCEYLLERLVTWLNGMQAPAENPELRFPIAVLKAVMAHLYIAWIHPFGDGNGRTARMIEFQLMVEAGAPSPATHLLSNHYNLTRDVYLIELDRTSNPPRFDVRGFILYALQGLVDQLREQIDKIKELQHDVAWINFVHEVYQHEETPAKRRQLHLVLDMPRGVSVPRNKLREVSTRMAGEYAGTGSKTLTRDLNVLQERDLLVRDRTGFRSNRDIISAFLPLRREPTE